MLNLNGFRTEHLIPTVTRQKGDSFRDKGGRGILLHHSHPLHLVPPDQLSQILASGPNLTTLNAAASAAYRPVLTLIAPHIGRVKLGLEVPNGRRVRPNDDYNHRALLQLARQQVRQDVARLRRLGHELVHDLDHGTMGPRATPHETRVRVAHPLGHLSTINSVRHCLIAEAQLNTLLLLRIGARLTE